jgi:hypothetical protein
MAKESLIEGRQDIGAEEEISWMPNMNRLKIFDKMTPADYRLLLQQEQLLMN